MSRGTGFVCDGSTSMIVSSTPSPQLAYTNLSYCSPADFHFFSFPGSNIAYALISESFVLSVDAHDSINRGHIGLNAVHRRHAKVSLGDMVSVSRFIPPDDFNLAMLWVELDFIKKGNKDVQVDAGVLAQQIRKMFISQVVTSGQMVPIEYLGTNYLITVNQAVLEGQEKIDNNERGMITADTYIIFETSNSTAIKIVNQRESANGNIFRQKEFNLQSLGIGGLSEEFSVIFRMAFASRVFPPHVIAKLAIKHVKGMLLYGPPGTGKTLMARQIGKMLNGLEPKIVNGPEVLSKYVGESEKNIRNLFADAERDEKTLGDQSLLHIIIFDEIDAICKARGSTRDGTGVHDGIVNQLLTKIDGVESLNNVLLIGMTNRKDLLDTALLRPGRLEVQVQISLPDENGRFEILEIHTNKMKENSCLAPDVNLKELAVMTKNYSGAELEGLVRSAVAFALTKQLSPNDLTKPKVENIIVSMEDFLNAFQGFVPAFGTSTDDLQRFRHHGMVKGGLRHDDIYQRMMLLVERVRNEQHSQNTSSSIFSCLLGGPSGSGKSAMAATIGIDSGFPYVKIISAESIVGCTDSSKCAHIRKVFEDAYMSSLSVIIVDDIEQLLEYDGRDYSRSILQVLIVLLKKLPPKGKNILIIGTTTKPRFLQSVDIHEHFEMKIHVPSLTKHEIKNVLEQLNVFRDEDIDSAVEALNDISIKKLYILLKHSTRRVEHSGSTKIDLSHFYDCIEKLNNLFDEF